MRPAGGFAKAHSIVDAAGGPLRRRTASTISRNSRRSSEKATSGPAAGQGQVLFHDRRAQGHGSHGNGNAQRVVGEARGHPKRLGHVRNRAEVHVFRLPG